MYRDHQQLLDYLSRSLGREVTLKIFADYKGLVHAIRDGSVELAWLGPRAYIEADEALSGGSGAGKKSRGPIRIDPIVKPRRRGHSEYASEIIVRKDSGIDTIIDLRGKSFAFVDSEATAGYLLAAAHLMKCGISENDPLLTRKHFLNQYGNVVLSVLFGKFDAGAVFEGAPALFLKGREADRQKELRVLARSDPVPYEPIAAVVGGNLSEAEAKKTQSLFLDMNTHPEILKKLQVDGFEAATAAEYESIRIIIQMVKRINQGT